MTNDEATQIILNAGIVGGWTLMGDVLTLWEHEEEPPAPLVRPTAGNNGY